MIYYKKKAQQDVGATAIEYGVLSALIAVATITGLQLTGVKLDRTYCIVASTLGQAVGAGGGGCSGSSSNSANKSASSANGSSSDSSANASADSSSDASDSSSSSDSSNSADSSSDTSSDADSSSPGPVIYNASNSYSVRDQNGPDDGKETLNILDDAAQHGITGITGLYDKYGKDITTPSQLASMLGVENQYDAYANAMDAFNKSPTMTNRIAAQNAKKSLYNNADSYYQSHQNYSTLYSPQIFLKNPSDVSFSGTDSATGQNFTTTYTKHADNYGYGNRDPSHTTAANFTTGFKSGTLKSTGFQLAFDMPK